MLPTIEAVADEPIVALATSDLSVSYGGSLAVTGVNLEIPERVVTAMIGPSGCGKSTVLRCFNRMNDEIPNARVRGSVMLFGRDLYAPAVDPVVVRRNVGMVFQRANPFPSSIFENVAFGLRVNQYHKREIGDRVERALRSASLWEEVKDHLKRSALTLSGGQQQRLCIARAIAIEPSILLMDEPCSALDPISTAEIERLIRELQREFTIIIVTHNMQQASRISQRTAFFNVRRDGSGVGYLAEYGSTSQIFDNPSSDEARDYISGVFG